MSSNSPNEPVLEGLPIFSGWVQAYDQPILLVLEDEGHLEKAVRYLIRAGLSPVYNVLGSVKAWVAASYPVTTD